MPPISEATVKIAANNRVILIFSADMLTAKGTGNLCHSAAIVPSVHSSKRNQLSQVARFTNGEGGLSNS
jgi:hypothetical protein